MAERVAFYSYKGGTGRSTALANVAYALAEGGNDVVCVDYDMEAAGLYYIFDLDLPGNRKYVQDYVKDKANSRAPIISEYVVDINQENSRLLSSGEEIEGGSISVIPADPGESEGNMVYHMPESASGLGSVMNDMCEEIENMLNPDYILLDSRSGISLFAIPCLLAADSAAVFFKWTHQHKRGTARTITWLTNNELIQMQGGGVDVYPVASVVPKDEDREEINRYTKDEIGDDEASVISVIPENDFLKKRERIMTMERPNLPVSDRFREIAEQLKKDD